jgi:hypothetical protein
VMGKQPHNPGVYALVNRDAHSRIWSLAKSSTVGTCCRVTIAEAGRAAHSLGMNPGHLAQPTDAILTKTHLAANER